MKKILTAGALALALTGVAAPAHAVTTETSDVKLSRSFSSAPQTTDGRSFYNETDGHYATMTDPGLKAFTAQTTGDIVCDELTGECNRDGLPWRFTSG